MPLISPPALSYLTPPEYDLLIPPYKYIMFIKVDFHVTIF